MITIMTPYKLHPSDKERMENAITSIDGIQHVTPRDVLALDVIPSVRVAYNDQIVEAIEQTLAILGFKHSHVVEY